MLDNKRLEIIDYIKGVCIVLMVLAHAGGPWPNFIYVFHMPTFFVCMGYCYKQDTSVLTFVKKRIEKLYIPFVAMQMIVILLRVVLEKLNIMPEAGTENMLLLIKQTLMFQGGTTVTFQNWFLRTAFFSTIIFHLIMKLISALSIKETLRESIIFAVSAGMLLLGWIVKNKSVGETPYDWNIATCIFFIEMGRLVRTFGIIEKLSSMPKKRIVCFTILSLFAIGLMSPWRVELSQNEIVNPVFISIGTALGLLLLIGMYNLEDSAVRMRFFVYCGKHSIWIMLLHFMAFKIVTYYQIVKYGYPFDSIFGAFTSITMPNWWIVYTIIGVCVPLAVYKLVVLVGRNSKLLHRQ